MLALNSQFSGNRIMKKSKLFYLKNGMLGANFIANFIGVFLVNNLILRAGEPILKELLDVPVVYWTNVLFRFCDDITL
jgi:hypothetical protein